MIDVWCTDCNREPWFNYAIGEYICPECGRYIQDDDVSEDTYNERRDTEEIPDDGYYSDENDNDPSTYAHCGDWEDEPENCSFCADDECPLNRS